MAFQIKDFISITAAMVNRLRVSQKIVSDFNVGSVERTLVEAPAQEIDQLYQQMFVGLKEAIPVATYDSFNFALIAATPAAGPVRVTITSQATAVTIGAGARFTREGSAVTYVATQSVVIPAGGTIADVPVQAEAVGTAGNIEAGLAFTVAPPPDGFIAAVNLAPLTTGREEETANERKTRFGAWIRTLSRATPTALEYGLKAVTLTDANGTVRERVAAVQVDEPYTHDPLASIASVNCYIHNGVGQTSGELVTRALQVITGYRDADGRAVPGWKAAGIPVTVLAAAESAVDLAATVTVAPSHDAQTARQQAAVTCASYVAALEIGQPILKSELIARVMAVPGVTDVVFSAPVMDSTPAALGMKLMPGQIAMTAP